MSDQRAWQVVLATDRERPRGGALKPGDHLPPERALAAELGVGRSSVREAVRVLEVLGLIRTQTGSGPSSGAVIIAAPSGGMRALMRLQVAAQGFPVRRRRGDPSGARDGRVAELAERRSAADLDRGRALLAAMDDEATHAARSSWRWMRSSTWRWPPPPATRS